MSDATETTFPVTNLGLDVGNSDTKSFHTTTPSGFASYPIKPYGINEFLFYEGRFYVPNSERFPYIADKTTSENAFILSLFGIAKEILYRAENTHKMNGLKKNNTNFNEETNSVQTIINQICKFNLGIGLPPTHYASLCEKNLTYYKQHFEKPVEFIYNDYSFKLKLNLCECYPQGLAAVMAHSANEGNKDSVVNYPSYIAVDIGGWTVDIVTFINGELDNEKCDSKPLGVLKMYDTLLRKLEMETGKRYQKDIIECVLRDTPTIIEEDHKQIILTFAKEWLYRIISELSQFGVDFDTYPVVFIGGGSLLFKKFIDNDLSIKKYEYIEDPHSNAKGYELLLELMTTQTA